MDIVAHLVIAVLIQLMVARFCRSWNAGAAAASTWAISREITQAEYRWIELYGGGLRANMPWWGGFDVRVWLKSDPWLDWLLPTLLVFAISLTVRKVSEVLSSR
jgi:hypothetical protein